MYSVTKTETGGGWIAKSVKDEEEKERERRAGMGDGFIGGGVTPRREIRGWVGKGQESV